MLEPADSLDRQETDIPRPSFRDRYVARLNLLLRRMAEACMFTDPAVMTAVTNDLSSDAVFAEPLHGEMRPGDPLVATSNSGGSPNILRAAEAAPCLGGQVIPLSHGQAPPPRGLGCLNFHVGATTYGQAESAHVTILHHWLDMVSGCQWEAA